MRPAPVQRLGPRANEGVNGLVGERYPGTVDGEAEGRAGAVEVAIVGLSFGADEASGGVQRGAFGDFNAALA